MIQSPDDSMIQSDHPSHPIILYDGVCGLCDRLVQFVLKRDRDDRFRFAALQSAFARAILQRHGLNPDLLDTFHLVFNYGESSERVLARSDAVSAVLDQLGSWRILARLFGLFPRQFRDWQYNLIARSRYRLFGKRDACPLPDPTVRHKFLDLP
jgi:predicted DCC family thiol-disulfide oxidoreductase YuxK